MLIAPLAAPIEIAQTIDLPAASQSLDAEPRPISGLEQRAIIHHQQLQLHQGFALATLGLMAVDSGLGFYDSNYLPARYLGNFHTLHVALGGATLAAYIGAATLALTAPQGYQVSGDQGWDSVAIHRDLAWFHGTALAATVVLGGLTAAGYLPPVWHGVAGAATLGLMATSAGMIALDF